MTRARPGSDPPGPPPSSTTASSRRSTAGRRLPGSRTRFYSNASYLKAAAPFANITLQSIDGTDPDHPTLNPVPYVGVQYVDIPQGNLGMTVGQQIGAIAGTESVSQAISAAQSAARVYTPSELSGSN